MLEPRKGRKMGDSSTSNDRPWLLVDPKSSYHNVGISSVDIINKSYVINLDTLKDSRRKD